MKISTLFFILFSIIMNAQNLQSKLENVYKQNELLGLSVYIKSKNSEQNYVFGLQNLERNIAITSETKYRVASISKAFTALGLIKLYDQKKFKLDDDISEYLGFKLRNPNFPEAKITFKMLLSHTSSINDGSGYDGFLDATYNDTTIPNIKSVLVENEKWFTNDMWLTKKPGSYFTYCNLNYGLIGTLIEKISKQRFDIYMENEILVPLGITGSYNISKIKDIENVATLYRYDSIWNATKDDYSKNKPSKIDLPNYSIGTNGVYFAPQGGLRVSAKEIGLFLEFLKSNGKTVAKLVSKSTVKRMKKTVWKYNQENGDSYNGLFNKWSLGLHKINSFSKDKIAKKEVFGNFIGHAGDAYGLISDAYFSEKEDLNIVIITNGVKGTFKPGLKTAFYLFEEEIFDTICTDYLIKSKD